MKNKFYHFTTYLLGFLLTFSTVFAKDKFGQEADTLVRGAQWIQTDERFGTFSFIQLRSDFIVEESQQLTWLKSEALGLSNNYSFKLLSIENDELSYTHYRYKMYYNDIPMEPGTFYIHVRNGIVTSANGEYALFNSKDIHPSISREIAFQTAVHHAQLINEEGARSTEIELMRSNGFLVLLQLENQQKLAWKFELNQEAPTAKDAYVYIDAQSGEYLHEENLIHYINYPLNVPSIYSGIVPIICDKTTSNTYFLNETVRKIRTKTYNKTFGGSYFITDIFSQDSLWNVNSNLKAGIDVHFGLETSFDFFLQKFSRNSYDNLGHTINANINYPYSAVPNYNSGFFNFPPKDNMNQLEQATLELVGHEYAHAVIKSTANLNTTSEAGGLSESFADIFGIAIDFYKNPTTANFIIGDRTKVNGVPDRDLGNPFQFGHPYVYNSVNWVANSPYHLAGVQNYWFYLLVNGGSGTTNFGVNYQINAIGMEAALKIAYRTLTAYLTSNSNYVAARTGSIQAATDLYGACSREVKEVTKAWYSLNVGGNYLDGVAAGALISQTTLCNGTALTPLNISINGSTYEWDFGDGTTSTLINPTHVYSQPGTYTLTLIATGTSTCNTTDTLIIPNIIINSNSALAPPLCLPTKQSVNGSVGIYRLQFADIDNYSSSSYSEGNQDFSCESFTTIHPGDNVEIIVTTSANTLENVKAWIDYNNDGDFTASEIIYESLNKKMYHKGIVLTDTNALLNTPLRMRVIDDYQQIISGACDTLLFGQSEDYIVTFIPISAPPLVNFIAADTIIPQGDSVQFFDLTVNSGALSWSFPGGTPATSTLENPFVTYNQPGVYPVTLVVTTNFGTDSITKTSYIHVTNTYTLCGTTNISNDINGTLYDSGGPNGPVTGLQFCEFMIDPGCANSITINFSSIQIGNSDYISIINRGPYAPASGNIVATFNGTLANANASVTVTGGKMLVRFSKNSTTSYNGFVATWTSDIFVDQPPIASFIPDSYTPPFSSPVRFENQSQGGDLDFIWDFGDGDSSGTSNAIHEYDSAGTYVVTLIASNCLGADTTSLTITVQEPPLMLVTTDTIDVTISCGDSITVPVMVYNNGLGDLLISENGYTNMDDTIHVLAYSAYQSSSSYMNIITSHLDLNFPKYTITKFTTNDTNYIKQALENKQVLLFPWGNISPDTGYSVLQGAVNDFMQRGGNVVVFGGSASSGDNRLRDMNILNAKPLPAYYFTNISVLDTTDFLTENLSSTFPQMSYYGFPVSVLNKHKKTLITNNADEVLAYRNYGKGKGIYNGLNTNTNNITVGRTIVNCIKSAQNRWPDWLLASPESDIIHPGDSSIAYFTIKPFKLTPGLHNAYIRINGNDSSNLSHEFVLRLNILSSPLLTFQDSCLDFELVTVGDSLTKNIIIQNPGCDTLIITSISSTHPDFTVYADSFLLPIATSASFNVSFKPQTVGSYLDTLYFQTNIGIIPYCIAGTGTIEPIIYIPDSIIYLSHDVCGGSDSVGFWLYNTGGNYLHYSLTGGTVDLPRRILMNVYGVDLQHEYLNTVNSIQQNFANILIDTTSLVNSNTFFPLLKNKDVVLFPRQETGASYISAVSNSIRNFVNTGGNAIILGMDFHTNIGSNPIIYSSGLFSGSDTADVSSGNSIVMDTTDWFVKNVNPIFTNPTTTYLQKITDLNKKTIVSSYGKDVVTVKKYGNGNATYIGYDYNLITSDIQKILANAIEFAYRDNFTIGFSASPDSGTIAPGDSVFIMVKSAIDGFAAGSYAMPIAILGNDPLVLNDTIIVQVQLGSNPCADFNAIATLACDGTMSFTQNLLNPGTTWKWYFGDGDSSSVQDPIHTYLTNGTKTVTLISTNPFGTDTITKTISITRYIPATSITGTPIVGSNLTFNANLNTGQFNRLWDFGDGSATSTASVPTHAYSLPGTYIITVLFTNAICTIPHTDTIVILPVGISELIAAGSFDIRPNPSVQEAEIRFELIKTGNVSLEIIDVTGRCIERFCQNERKIAGKYVYKFNANSSGIYSVLLRVNDELMTLKLVKTE